MDGKLDKKMTFIGKDPNNDPIFIEKIGLDKWEVTKYWHEKNYKRNHEGTFIEEKIAIIAARCMVNGEESLPIECHEKMALGRETAEEVRKRIPKFRKENNEYYGEKEIKNGLL